MHCILDIFIPSPSPPRSTSHSVATQLCVLPPSSTQCNECCVVKALLGVWPSIGACGTCQGCLSVSRRLQRLSSVSLGIWSMKHHFGKILICAWRALDENFACSPGPQSPPPTQGKPMVSIVGSRNEVGAPG